jgi:hypothetical protein
MFMSRDAFGEPQGGDARGDGAAGMVYSRHGGAGAGAAGQRGTHVRARERGRFPTAA